MVGPLKENRSRSRTARQFRSPHVVWFSVLIAADGQLLEPVSFNHAVRAESVLEILAQHNHETFDYFFV